MGTLTPDKFSQPLPKDRLDELVLQIDKLLSQARRPPANVYHYTTAEGAKGIIESGKLWISNAEFLNDSLEVKLGLTKILRIIASRKRALSLTNPDGASFLERLAQTSQDLFSKVFDVYVTCFCERPDILSQWRNYGSGCVAIGFSVDGLRGLSSTPPAFPAYPILAKVDYSHDRQNAKVRQIIDLVVSYLQYATPGAAASGGWSNPLEIAANVLFGLIPSFKHQSFAEEKEWRLVKYLQKQPHSPSQGLCFRMTRYGLTPYFHLESSRDLLPITEVHYGPSLYIENTVRSLGMLAASKGYAIHFTKFETPFRL